MKQEKCKTNQEKIEEFEKRIQYLEKAVYSVLRPSKYEIDDEVKIEHWGKEFTGVVVNAYPEGGSGLNSFLWEYVISVDGAKEHITLNEYDLMEMNRKTAGE